MEDRNTGPDRLFAGNRELEDKWRTHTEASCFFRKDTPDPDMKQDIRNLQERLMRKHFFAKVPDECLDRYVLPRMQNVYALRHANTDNLQKIAEAFYAIPNEEVTDSIDDEFMQRWNAALYRERDMVSYYPVYPDDYFLLYDAPLLMYLYFQEKLRPGLLEFREENFPPFFSSVFDKTPKSELETSYFGVSFQKNVPLKNSPVLSVTAFCMNGRLEAYRRFITYSRRAKNVHMFQYFTRWLPDPNTHRDPPGFREEDAWYYEMCTGLSLVTEITALLMDLDIMPVITDQQDAETGKEIDWQFCRGEIITGLLRKYRECIIACPAIYWRAAALRNAIRLTDKQCEMEQSRMELLRNPAYTRGMTRYFQRTKSEWREFAGKAFDRLFYNDLGRIHISRMDFMGQQALEQSGFTNPVHDLAAPEPPRSTEFLSAAETCIINCLQSGPAEIGKTIIGSAVKDSYTASREHAGFYFYGCLPKTDTHVEEMIQSAEGRCRTLKKIRNVSVRDQVFEIVHRALYGTGSGNDKGFRQPEDF